MMGGTLPLEKEKSGNVGWDSDAKGLTGGVWQLELSSAGKKWMDAEMILSNY